MSKHFLNLKDLTKTEILDLVKKAIDLKGSEKNSDYLHGKYLALIFEKSSTRTRVSFEVAMSQLGGTASFLSTKDLSEWNIKLVTNFQNAFNQSLSTVNKGLIHASFPTNPNWPYDWSAFVISKPVSPD